MRFVDMQSYDLERLAAEQRTDARMQARSQRPDTPPPQA
jgi:hypothetical protein